MSGHRQLREAADALRRDYAHLLTRPRISEAPQAARPVADRIEEARERVSGRRRRAESQLSLDLRA